MDPLIGRRDVMDRRAQKARLGSNLGAPALLGLCLALLLGGCSSPNISIPAPVVDHSLGKPNTSDSRTNVASKAPVVTSTATNINVNENSTRPGYYTVKPGDTIFHISLDNGQNWKDLAKWNNIDNPNVIDVGRVLRVVPPEASVTTDGVVVRPVNSQNNPTTSTGTMTSVGTVNGALSTSPPTTTPSPAAPASASIAPAPGAAPASQPAVQVPQPAPSVPSSTENASENPTFIWPANGKLIATFDESKNKGVDISGKLGDPVLAAADGKVVYSGSGLRGYGNLLIIKHNNTYLSAYAHNQTILVKEDQSVKQGQKIAEVGNSDADQPELHFEIRKYGKPVDPLKWLPPR